MSAIKTTFVLLLLAFAMVIVVAREVTPCDQVCHRSDAEKDSCCRAHGERGFSYCTDSGTMHCY
ncbi:hypothetical protein ABMA28_016146 [Loxostege sticticalis]|uniref:Uncharacterized protein n=1 Tax=Loxostege sticticalis TaxID=481309 RepID=A0ABD0TAQ4_LOXSC